MVSLSRTDTSVVGRWWWTVDRWMLVTVAMLIAIGYILTLAASPAVATRLDLGQLHFVERQAVFLSLGVPLMFAVSLLPPLMVRRVAVIGLAGALFLMLLTLLIGPELNGAHRWLAFGGMTLQPSEFVKPTFAVVAAWMLADSRRLEAFPGNQIAIGLYAVIVLMLLAQPDVGMALVVSAVWFAQVFIAGLPMFWVTALIVMGLAAAVIVYSSFDHVADRVNAFLDSDGGGFQIERAMDAFANGGFWGTGPGQGAVKRTLPDAHTDFIFAVAGEEFGLLLCLLIVGLFAFLVLRGFSRLMAEDNLFIMLASAGLLTQFGLQAVINIGVNLSLMPTKGMTLPFISYGGSSMLSLALGMGMRLALTRQRPRLGGAE